MNTSSKTSSKYQQCYQEILQYITVRQLKEGDKLPTEQQLTEMLGVSRITVRRAVSALEESGIVRKIQGSGTFLALSPTQSHTIKHVPMILPRDANDLELLNAIQGADKCLSEHGCYLTPHFIHTSAEEERRILSQLIDRGTRCVMLFPYDESQNQDYYSRLERSGVQLIFLDRISPHVSGCFVGCDNVKGGYLATSHLLRQGYRRIALLGRMPRTEAAGLAMRLLGYQDALEEYGIEFREEYVSFTEIGSTVAASLNRLLSLPERPDAIFCVNDLTALDAIRELEAVHLRVPEDIALIGFDNSCILKGAPLGLSTIDQSFYDIGYEAAQIACDILEGKLTYHIHKILPVSLIVRNTTPKK